MAHLVFFVIGMLIGLAHFSYKRRKAAKAVVGTSSDYETVAQAISDTIQQENKVLKISRRRQSRMNSGRRGKYKASASSHYSK
jgi:hypothetical protein